MQWSTADTKEVAVDMHWVVVADAARAVLPARVRSALPDTAGMPPLG